MRRKLNLKVNKMLFKENGFTLIEVLSTLAIIATVFGIACVVYVNVINKSKTTEEKLAIDNLRNAAELFAKEGEIGWINKYDDVDVVGDYMCITVNDLINNGYFKESFLKNDIYVKKKITGNSYFRIDRGINKSIESITLQDDNNGTDAENFNSCMLKYSELKINATSYTDTIVLDISIDDEELESNSDVKYNLTANSGISSCDNNKCIISKLKDDNQYEMSIQAIDGSNNVLANSNIKLQTEKMPKPSISFDKNNLTIVYSDENIYDRNNIKYLLKSDIDLNLTGSDDYAINKCNDNNNVSTIEASECYEVNFLNTDNKEVNFTYDYSQKKDKINAYINDKNGNVGVETKNYNDYSKPLCNISVEGNKKENWYTGNVTLKLDGNNIAYYDLTTNDTTTPNYKAYTGSAIANQTSDTTSSGIKWYAYVKSTSGEVEKCSVTIYKDSTAPKCSVIATKGSSSNVVPSTNNYSSGSWYSGYVGTKASCSDDVIGCDTSRNTVTVTGASSNVTNSQQATRAVNVQGTSYVTWRVYDKLGNSSTCSLTVRLDRGDPSCSVTKSNTGRTSGVTATFKCSDSYSGVTCVSTKSGLKSSQTYTIKDNAGNTGICKVSVSSSTQYRYLQKASKVSTCTKSCCGYKTCANRACGVKAYKSGKSCSICGKTVKNKTESKTTNDCRTCKTKPSGSGWKLTGSSGAGNFNKCGKYAIKCYWKRTVTKTTCLSCRNKAFGVQSYKSCATSACGSKTCTSSSCCGTTSYCSSSYGSWGGGNTGCSRQSRVIYK